jgi:hypothetical protein
MPMDLKIVLKDLTPDQAATMLAQAQQAYFNLLTGQLPSGVETPQLGRVTYCATTAADLQRLIAYLNNVVAGSATNGSGNVNVRIPFSFYGWP